MQSQLKMKWICINIRFKQTLDQFKKKNEIEARNYRLNKKNSWKIYQSSIYTQATTKKKKYKIGKSRKR